MSTAEPASLLFQPSPWGTLDAIVQHDGRAIYFILNGPPPFGTRPCWVANLVPGPLEFNQADLAAGQFPVLPRVHQVEQPPVALPASDDLEVVWFESGDAAALFWNRRLVSVIPPWGGLGGFRGYAANCATENLVCSPFPPGEKLEARVQQAAEYWQRWRDDPPFRTWQPECLSCYAGRFGTQEQYWSVDGGRFPPRGVAQFRDQDGAICLMTVGMSLCFQPEPRVAGEVPGYWPCVELGLEVPGHCHDHATIDRLVARLGSLSAHPWRTFSWLGAGHTCDLLPGADGIERAAIRTNPERPWVISPETEAGAACPVRSLPPAMILWLVPG
jgi:Suppressor of fused protein (SUFU)